jgi:1-deoxy-D-xylulose-5-phosphate reductoisomerase
LTEDGFVRELFEVETEPVRVAVCGSTGSIGRQTLDVVRAHGERIRLVALAAGSDAETLSAQAREFQVPIIGLASGEIDAPPGTEVILGEDSAERIASVADAQVVVNAVVGAAGLKATLAALDSGARLALANKESLIAAGELVMAKASPDQIRPVDSEHSAAWQVLQGLRPDEVRRLYITGSGGPFRGKTEGLENVTVADALAHPVWEMGRKITIDSATLMNKGLEVIEAHFLFGLTYDEIEVVIHPQGVVHALVETIDGSLLAHAAMPDMRLPIQVALLWPDRTAPPGGERLELAGKELTFEYPDTETFRCLDLAREAGRLGDTYPAVLNAANEEAVSAFLDGRIGFLQIPELVERVMEEHSPLEPRLEEVLEADGWARLRAVATIELVAS